MKKIFLIIAMATLALTGCSRELNKLSRNFQNSERQYHIEVYSGGQKIKTYDFKGIVDNQEKSDGYFFYYNGELTEVSGTVIISSK